MQHLRSSKLLLKSTVTQKCRHISNIMFSKYLLATNIGISMSLSATGDIIQQRYEMFQEEGKKWDAIRTRNMSISGVTVGIVCHYTYNFMDNVLPGRTFKLVMKKVVLDQLIFSPIYLGVFFTTLAWVEGSNLRTLMNEVTQKGWRLYLAEWIVWPPAQVINFYFLPTKFRVLYDNIISLGFDIYTSYVKHNIPIDE